MSAVLAEITPGFRDAIHGAQQAFRCLLDATARPGRVYTLGDAAIDGIVAPPAAAPARELAPGTAALLLTLLDAETRVHLAGSLSSAPALAWLRFHTGVRLAGAKEPAEFSVVHASELAQRLWESLPQGSDDAPQHGATLIVEVDALDAGAVLRLRGPGIETEQTLRVAGVPPAFWTWRRQQTARLPRGIELLLVCGTQIVAIPRSTRLSTGF